MRIDSFIQSALDNCGAPYEVKRGSNHIKIYVGGRLAGILPVNGRLTPDKRARLNTVAQIRRAAQGETA